MYASSKKPMFMPSMMGRRPVMAAPMPIPMKPFSADTLQYKQKWIAHVYSVRMYIGAPIACIFPLVGR